MGNYNNKDDNKMFSAYGLSVITNNFLNTLCKNKKKKVIKLVNVV